MKNYLSILVSLLFLGSVPASSQSGCNISASINTLNNVTCNGGSDGIVSVVAAGGLAPYTYSWSPGGGNNSTASGLSAGAYFVTITDNTECSIIALAEITQPTLLGVAIDSVKNVGCSGIGGSISTGLTVITSYGFSAQRFPVPAGVNTLTLTIAGAQGGSIAPYSLGGWGAEFTAILSVTPGHVLYGISGAGGNSGNVSPGAYSKGGAPYFGGGGGGGSFLYDSNTFTLLAVAGGGGGTGFDTLNNYQTRGAAGGINLIADNTTTSFLGNGAGGTGSNGGNIGNSNLPNLGMGAGGAGWLSNGASTSALYNYSPGGSDEANGFSGGIIPNIGEYVDPWHYGYGGYGGGGAGGYWGGGGGGGYNGGGGGNAFINPDAIHGIGAGGGGGASYLNGMLISTPSHNIAIDTTPTADIWSVGLNGFVTISYYTPGMGGVPPYTYSWSPTGGTDSVATGLSAGTYTLTVTDNNGCNATASATITQVTNTVGVTIASVNNISCHGGTGTITANVAGEGLYPYTYSWSGNGGTNLVTSPLSAGTYTLTATDSYGCSATASAIITQPEQFGISIASVTNVNCNGGNGAATANSATGGTSPYTYLWAPAGGTNLMASNLAAGTYTITARDGNGCSASAFVTITQPPVLDIAMSSFTNVLCNGGTGTATAGSATGGTAPYTYEWEPNLDNTLTATVSAGSYTIIVIDNNGCTALASATLTQPATAIGISIASQTNILCNGGTGTVTANAAIGGISPYTYSWSGNAGTNLNVTVTSGTYSITATDNHGCTSIASVTITQPAAIDITTSATVASCNGGAAGKATATPSGGTSPYTYSWSPGGGSNATASGLSAGTYTVHVTGNGGCSSSATVTISQSAGITITTLATADETCNGGSTGKATATVSGGTSPYTYSWSPGGRSTSSVSGLSAGTYTVHVTSNGGCTATASVIITQPTVISIATSVTANESCSGGANGKATATASGGTSPYTYSWSPNGGSASTATGLSAGTYTVHVTSHTGCTATASINITQPAAIRDSISSSTCTNNKITATVGVKGGTSPYTYSWTPGGGTKSIESGLSAGTYTITIHDKNDCSATLVAKLRCGYVDSPVKDTANGSSNNCCLDDIDNINLYPNPNNGQFTIAGIENGMIVEVYDYTGRKVNVVVATDKTMQLNIYNQSNGIYLIRITDKDGNLVGQKKAVKMQ